MFRYIAAIVAVAIAAAPRNVAADSNPARLRLHGISDSDFDRGVDPATLLAAKTSSRELSGTIVWSDPVVGDCQDSAGNTYPYAVRMNPDIGTSSLEDWCKAWCEQVEPEKVVGIAVNSDSSVSECYCYFSNDCLPNPFPGVYNPEATDSESSYDGAGCITQADGTSSYQCYRNAGCTSCPITTAQPSLMPSESLMPSAQPSLMQTSKSGKMSKASIAKSGKTNKVTANQMDESFMVTLSATEEEEGLSFSFGPVDDLSLDYNFAMGEDDEAKDTMSL